MKKLRQIIARSKRAQASIEYLILLGVVAAIVLGGYTWWVGHSRDEGYLYFDKMTKEIYGTMPVTRSSSSDAYP